MALGHAFFELRFSPNARLVTVVRRFVIEFYERVLGDPEATSRVAVATHELLENAVKYASDGETGLRIEVKEEGSAPLLLIRTTNRASAEQIKLIEQQFAEIAAEKDAAAYYQKLMRRAAQRTDGSGLGLGRVRAEAAMELKLEVEQGRVHVFAQAKIQPGTES